MTGGLRGTVSAGIRRIPPWAVVMLLALTAVAVNYHHNLPCANGHPGPDVLWRKACYSDILGLYSGRGLSEGDRPFLDHNLEYPVLIGGLMALVGLPVHALGHAGRLDGPAHALGFETVDEGVIFYWGTAAVLGLLILVITWAMLRSRRERPWDVARWTLAPGLLLAATINWDLLAVALTSLALLAWSRSRPALAGVLLGLGAAAKLYPVLLLGPLVLLCLRAGTRRSVAAALKLVGAAILAWLAVNLPIILAAPNAWLWSVRFSQDRWIDWGSLWFILDHLGRDLGFDAQVHPLLADVEALNRSSVALFGACCLGIAALVRWAPRPPRVAAVSFLVVAAFLLTNKVWSPQFVLWLIPLAVLARPRWGTLLVWQAAEVGYLAGVMRTVLGERDDFAMVLTAIARWSTVAALVVLVVIDVLHPERDQVRGPDGADPDAGVLAAPATRTGITSRHRDPVRPGHAARSHPPGTGAADPRAVPEDAST